jgi:AbrB family looped-hinge helix DNA binding protein
MNSTVTIKGQITIPKAMRDYLNLEPGDKVVFTYLEAGGVRIEPAKRGQTRKAPKSRFAALRGRAAKGARTNDLMRLLRGYGEDAKDPGFRK